MNLIVCPLMVIPFAKQDAEHQRSDTGTDVNHVTAGKVYRADLRQKSAVCPNHMCHGIIYQDAPEHDKEEQRLEFHSATNRTCDQRRRNHSKHHLEQAEYQIRNRLPFHICLCFRNTFQSQPAQITDDSKVVCAERQRISKQNPHHDAGTDGDHRSEHRIDCVLPTNQTAVKIRQAGGHKKHKCGTNHHKTNASRIHNTFVLPIVIHSVPYE